MKHPGKFALLLGLLCAVALLLAQCRLSRSSSEDESLTPSELIWRPPTENPLLAEDDSSEPDVSTLREALRGKTVVLDPGHGFGDVGCAFPDGTLCEKDVTPVLVSKVRSALEADGVTVLQTHDGQKFPTVAEMNALAESLSYDLDGYLRRLVGQYSHRTPEQQAETVRTFREGMTEDDLFNIYERSYCANLLSAGAEVPASLFVSIHVNANADSSALSGFELYRCTDTPYVKPSASLSDALARGLAAAFPQTAQREIAWDWEEAFAVNKYPDMPSALIESGYATNPTDAQNLRDEAWQNAFARAVADGIEYFLLSGQ